MRLIFILSILSTLCFGAALPKPQKMVGGIVVASSTNVTASFSSAGTLLSGLVGKQHVAIINEASSDIGVNISAAGACSTATATDFYVLGNNAGVVLDNVLVAPQVCVRSMGSTITTGSIYGWAW